MPIEATPVNKTESIVVPAPIQVTTIEKPMMKYVDKSALTSRMRSFSISAQQAANLEFVFQNENGDAFDLTNVPINNIRAILAESVSGGRTLEHIVSYIDAKNGKLNIYLNTKMTSIAGVYNLIVQLFDDSKKEVLVRDDRALVYIAGVALSTKVGPPTILEIRLQLRDSSVEENSLLDGYNFSDEEIAIATMKPIQYFNETDPDVGIYFDTTNFPSRYYWTEGIIGQLFRIVEEYQRKNNLSYNSGGLSVDDRNKEQNYAQAGERHWAIFTEWAKRKKVKINIANGYGIINSYYAYRY